ncbi:hypothetical protein B0H19DRAFT_1069673 [Mycena capillaripes]|nr:hypothetical protein B0H19DRAFT_1069673 [Mycena capillaripes]
MFKRFGALRARVPSTNFAGSTSSRVLRFFDVVVIGSTTGASNGGEIGADEGDEWKTFYMKNNEREYLKSVGMNYTAPSTPVPSTYCVPQQSSSFWTLAVLSSSAPMRTIPKEARFRDHQGARASNQARAGTLS